MKYKKVNKAQKQQRSCLVGAELITGKRFGEIVKLLNDKSDLKNQDRYLYGYSLLRTQKKLQALIVLWPLASKGNTLLQQDCAVIAAEIFKNDDFLSTESLSQEDIYTLFLAARSLMPQSAVYHTLRVRVFDTLWQKREYEQVERILKSNKNDFSGILLENLGKLAFFQPEKKLAANIPAFVGIVLTGAASLIARNSLYHKDIADALHLLANEIKLLFSALKISNKKKMAWDSSLFENFVDYEVSILSRVLAYRISDDTFSGDIIPTPSYLIHYDADSGRVKQSFLPWLIDKNKELAQVYAIDSHHAVLWAFGETKLSDGNSLLKLIHRNAFSPYLRLALMLRLAMGKKFSLEGIVLRSDFEGLNDTDLLFEKVARKTALSMLSPDASQDIPEDCWKVAVEFCSVLQDDEVKKALIKRALPTLHQKHEYEMDLNLEGLKELMHSIEARDLVAQLDSLVSRQQICLEFLSDLDDKKKNKKFISSIKNEAALRSHLTLIADCCCLVYPDLTSAFFHHIEALLESKKINKLIPLNSLIDCGFDCHCSHCESQLYRNQIPSMSNKLNLPVVCLPHADAYSTTESRSNTSMAKSSLLAQPDPFEILGVSVVENKATIMQKVMKLMQHSPEKMAILRQAQNELFDPTRRFVHQYLRYFAYDSSNKETQGAALSLPINSPVHEIPLRHELLNAK